MDGDLRSCRQAAALAQAVGPKLLQSAVEASTAAWVESNAPGDTALPQYIAYIVHIAPRQHTLHQMT
jgi:hypothetical protein